MSKNGARGKDERTNVASLDIIPHDDFSFSPLAILVASFEGESVVRFLEVEVAHEVLHLLFPTIEFLFEFLDFESLRGSSVPAFVILLLRKQFRQSSAH